MKRLNRKKLIGEFESLRQGFADACLQAAKGKDKVLLTAMAAHHANANRVIKELGGVPIGQPNYWTFFDNRENIRGAERS